MTRKALVIAMLLGLVAGLIPTGDAHATAGDNAVVAAITGFTKDAATPPIPPAPDATTTGDFSGFQMAGSFKVGTTVCTSPDVDVTTGAVQFSEFGNLLIASGSLTNTETFSGSGVKGVDGNGDPISCTISGDIDGGTATFDRVGNVALADVPIDYSIDGGTTITDLPGLATITATPGASNDPGCAVGGLNCTKVAGTVQGQSG